MRSCAYCSENTPCTQSAAVTAAALIGFGFAACSNDDDDDDDSGTSVSSYLPDEFKDKAIVAKYVHSDSGKEGDVSFSSVDTLYFFIDNAWLHTSSYKLSNGEGEDSTPYKGTYEGKAAEDGTVTLTVTHTKIDSVDWKASDKTLTLTISGGKVTYKDDEYTRQ